MLFKIHELIIPLAITGIIDFMVMITPSHSAVLGESLFPLEFYAHVQEIIDSLLTYPRPVEEVVDVKRVLSLYSQFLYMNYGRLYLFNSQTKKLQVKLGQSFSPDRLLLGQYEIGEGITGAAFSDEQVFYVKDIDMEPRYLGRNFKAKDLPYVKAGYLAIPFYGERESGVLGFHLGERPMADIYASAAIAFGIAEKIGKGALPLSFSYNRQR